MSDYDYFRKRHPEWPKYLRDAVGRCVRLKYEMETRGGTKFEEGEVLSIYQTWRGKLSLTNGEDHPNNRSISRVHPGSVELLRPTSIVWRNKEAFLLFCIAVAGKNSRQTQGRVEKLLEVCVGKLGRQDFSPFSHIGDLIRSKHLLAELKRLRFGQYKKLLRAFTEVVTADLNLDTVRAAQLEKIHGIGPKTARYFIMRTRPRAKVAALDTHVLRWLRDQGHGGIPESTPQSGKAYARVEKLFLAEAKKRRMRPSRLDAWIWDRYSRYGMSTGERSQVDEVAAFS